MVAVASVSVVGGALLLVLSSAMFARVCFFSCKVLIRSNDAHVHWVEASVPRDQRRLFKYARKLG